MDTAAVTPTMRSFGWNIVLFIEPDDVPFAGVFQPARNVSLTFRDIVDEIRLSFEFPHESSNVLNQVAFGLLKMVNLAEDECPAPMFVHSAGLDQRVPALPELRPDALKDRVILQYQFFKHHDCTLTAEQSLQRHVEGILKDNHQADEDLASMVAPPECNISDERAKTTMANFRSSCLILANHCAVTGMGRSWYNNPTIGPALQACHIVSQLHYHTYPPPQADADGAQENPHQLEQAWVRTWAPENGILLFSHLHEMFDQRLFSIHPETLQIRVFMPYDILLAYHGVEAKVQPQVAKAALRHHYDMCCIENMAAQMRFVEQVPRTGSVASTSGFSTPLRLAGIASPRILESASEQNQGQDGQRPDGDPTKRARQTGRQHLPGNASAGDISVNDLAAPPSF
ncbi:hypothetical protein MY10362_003286, partial [Beauveria mimosiformis]